MKRLAKRLTAAVLLAAVCLTATVYSRTKPVELRLGFMAGSYWDAPSGNCYAVIDAAIERFEREHPNVRVTYTSGILKRDYSEWLIDQYLLGSEPDVFLVLPEDFGTLCELGALAPLDGCLAQDKEVSDTDFYPAALQSGAENGVQYALPYECVPTLMCINKSLLESEGITVPSGDWTWEDFYHICARVTRDTDGDGENDQFGCCGYTWQDALTANGASLFTEDGGSCLISEPKSVQAVAFAQRLGTGLRRGKSGIPAVPVLGLPDLSAVSVAHQALLGFLVGLHSHAARPGRRQQLGAEHRARRNQQPFGEHDACVAVFARADRQCG